MDTQSDAMASAHQPPKEKSVFSKPGTWLAALCVAVFVGQWVQKGPPGTVPSNQQADAAPRASATTSGTTFDAIPQQISCVDGDPRSSNWESGLVMNFNPNGQLIAGRAGTVFTGSWWRDGDNFAWQIKGGSLADGRAAKLNKPAVTWVSVRSLGKNAAGETVLGVKSREGVETFCLAP